MTAISPLKRKQLLSQSQPSRNSRGVRLGGETATFIPADSTIRCLRDQMIVEPLDVIYSRHVIVDIRTKPLRGIVKAVGPGCYPKLYDNAMKNKRTKMWESAQFRPTDVQVGDVVELGGAEFEGYAFESFWYGDVMHIHCREADVCFIHEGLTAEQARAQAAPITGINTRKKA